MDGQVPAGIVSAVRLPGFSAAAPEGLPRLLAGARADGEAVSLAEHLGRHGELALRPRGGPVVELIELVEEAGLQGRGGAGFPMGRKLRAVAERRGKPIVLANAAEGEPVSRKDSVLLRCVPHLVLDGVAAAAAAVGSRDAIIALRAGAGLELAVVEAAIAERERRRVDRVAFQVAEVPDGFVTGEETALVSWLNGGPAAPTFTPPRPFERGVGRAPTLVQNVETLAHLGLIVRYGPEWFRAIGSYEEPGTALVTLGGAVRRPGVYEVALGLPLLDLVEWAGGASAPIAAFLVGGYFGAWVGARDADSVTLLESDLRPLGASLGARAIFVLPASTCGVVETARVARYLAGESAGQCGPCLYGLDAIATSLEQLASADAGRRLRDGRLERWLEQVTGRGACRHPDGAVRFVGSAVRVFAAEFELHAQGSCSGDGWALLPVGLQERARR
jgi:NADH:ubiquinone oxidoreductase subunit F (NADH-binding)